MNTRKVTTEKIEVTSIEYKNEGDTFEIKADVKYNTRDSLMFELITNGRRLASGISEKGEASTLEIRAAGQQLLDAAELFNKHLLNVEFTPLKKNKYKYSIDVDNIPASYTEEERQAIVTQVKEAMGWTYVKQVIENIILKPLREGRIPGPLQRPHKQSRTQLRTQSKLLGRDTTAPNLWNLDFAEMKAAIEKNIQKTDTGHPYKEVMSKGVVVLGHQLIVEYQTLEKDKEGYISIHELGTLADKMNTSLQELKFFLLYLGGYQYPKLTTYKETEEVGLRFVKMFDIEFVYSTKTKHLPEESKLVIGTMEYIKDTPIKRIRVKPHEQFIQDISERKALNYVDGKENFMEGIRGFSVYAYKLFSFSVTNKPKYKITEPKLFKHLGLEEQAKRQGLPRLREMLAKAFKELEENEHFSSYKLPFNDEGKLLEAGADLYEWNYTNKFIEHQDVKPKKETAPAEYVNFKDESIPLEDRRKAYKAWLINDKKTEPGKAARMASRLH